MCRLGWTVAYRDNKPGGEVNEFIGVRSENCKQALAGHEGGH